ncbi:MAG: cbb3-type cytochrome c oxidase subunit II [Spirochaetia bacterium]|nr:cbb3-type cytochrome c oxidase subunit II [Spirochaetia bacterium]
MKRLFQIVLWSIIMLLPMLYFTFLFTKVPLPSNNALVNVGRRVYEKSGCPVCHSRFVRSTMSDMVRFLPDNYLNFDTTKFNALRRFQNHRLDMFSSRIGSDLEYLTLSSTNDIFLEQYLKNPGAFNNNTLMPKYEHLFYEKLSQDEILFALGSLKNNVGIEKYIDNYTRGEALIYYLKEYENGI